MTIRFIFSPPVSYPAYLPPPVQAFPVEVSIVVAPPVVVAVRAAVGLPGVAVGIAAAEPPGSAVGIFAVWLPPRTVVLPGILVGLL